MQIGFSKIGFPKQGALVLGVLEDSKMLAKTQEVDRNSGGMITAAIKNSNFSGKSHQILSVFTPERRIVLYGLGKGENIDAKKTLDRIAVPQKANQKLPQHS